MAGLEQVSPEELATAGFIAQQGFNDGKNVAAYALMASPIQTALHCAGSDSSKSVEFNEVAIRPCYNLAANTWMGWGEDEVKIGDQEPTLDCRRQSSMCASHKSWICPPIEERMVAGY